MLLKQGYHIGMLGSTFILWNTTELINLESKNLQSAVKEAELIIKNKQEL